MSDSNASSKIAVWALLISLAAAVGVHTYLTFHFYEVDMGTSTGEAACNINETFNCDAVSASEYSSLFGVPIALYGAVTNGVLLLLALFALLGLSEERQRVLRYSFWLGTFVAGMSVIMGAISAALLSTLCLFCLFTYGFSVISWLALWRLQEESPLAKLNEDVERLFKTHRAVIASVLLIPALSYLFHFSFVNNSDGLNIDRYLDGIIADWKASEQIDFSQSASLHMQAESGSPVMSIVEFADFRCGHCKRAVHGLHTFLLNHKKNVEMKFYSFPLDGTCNEVIQRKGDGITCRLAKAVYCAGKEGDGELGWKMHDAIFEHQSDFNGMGSVSSADSKLKEISGKISVDFTNLESCMSSNETHEAILAQAKMGVTAGVEGTPAIYINGRKIQLGDKVKVLRRVYRELSR